jgi:hypothetical protein
MCDYPLCKYIEICEDEWGDKYVGHYKYGVDNTTLELFFTQFWEAEKTIKKGKSRKIKSSPILYND